MSPSPGTLFISSLVTLSSSKPDIIMPWPSLSRRRVEVVRVLKALIIVPSERIYWPVVESSFTSVVTLSFTSPPAKTVGRIFSLTPYSLYSTSSATVSPAEVEVTVTTGTSPPTKKSASCPERHNNLGRARTFPFPSVTAAIISSCIEVLVQSTILKTSRRLPADPAPAVSDIIGVGSAPAVPGQSKPIASVKLLVSSNT